MTKKEFANLICTNKDKYQCLSLDNYTQRAGTDRWGLVIIWNTGFNKTLVCSGFGNTSSFNAIENYKKYKKYADLALHKSR